MLGCRPTCGKRRRKRKWLPCKCAERGPVRREPAPFPCLFHQHSMKEDAMPSETKLARTPTYTTRGAMDTLIGDDVEAALARHFAGDWGDVCDEDRRSNDLALTFGQRLLS